MDDPESEASTSTADTENHDLKEDENRFQSLFERYSAQQKELERLEEQNAEYREKLLKTIRERDLNDELLRNVRDEHKKETEELRRNIRDLDIQLKAVQDKAAAQEAHYNTTMKDLSLKYNNSVSQLTKKADIAEKEKNEAVIKYAMREAEILRVKAEANKKDQELKALENSRKELEQSQAQENVHQLESTLSSTRVELEKFKHEKFDIENRFKMSEKRLEASQTTITELKQQCDVLRKQLIQIKEEKNHLIEEKKQIATHSQQQESRLQLEADTMSKSQSDLEARLQEASTDLGRLKESNRELSDRLSSVEKENLDLLTKLQDLEDKLQLEEEGHLAARKELQRLRDIESKVNRSLDAATKAKAGQEAAEKERETAEKEADECRQQAERMLQITEQLTQRNSQLVGEVESIREKNNALEHDLIEKEGLLSRLTAKLSSLEQNINESKSTNDDEVERLKTELKEAISREREAAQKYNETKNDFTAYKKKHAMNVKELKHELAQLRRQAESPQVDGYLSTPAVEASTSSYSRSRASSLTSLDRVTSGSQEESIPPKVEGPPVIEEVNPTMQQAMVDKIVMLQRKLARRTEKIEFLEEHVKQCLEELQKKTKLIQHYALREEASLLLPREASMDQVPVVRKGTSYALMGSMFMTSDKKNLQLVTEVNSRLQAVLEDTLLKNITLKSSLDSLSNDVTRLTRENRLLTLRQNKDSIQQ